MVKAHTRTVNGRPVKVRAHRRQLQPRRAGRNAVLAYRHGRRRRYTAAVVCGTAAVAEVGAWALLRGTGVVMMTAGIVAMGAYTLSRRLAQ